MRADRSPRGTSGIYNITISAPDPACNIGNAATQVLDGKRRGKYDANVPGVFDCVVIPNPSGQYFDIRITSESKEGIFVNLNNSKGKPVLSLKDQKSKIIRLYQPLKNGIYFAEVRQGGLYKVVSLIKQ